MNFFHSVAACSVPPLLRITSKQLEYFPQEVEDCYLVCDKVGGVHLLPPKWVPWLLDCELHCVEASSVLVQSMPLRSQEWWIGRRARKHLCTWRWSSLEWREVIFALQIIYTSIFNTHWFTNKIKWSWDRDDNQYTNQSWKARTSKKRMLQDFVAVPTTICNFKNS